jgi:hypothetical protein
VALVQTDVSEEHITSIFNARLTWCHHIKEYGIGYYYFCKNIKFYIIEYCFTVNNSALSSLLTRFNSVILRSLTECKDIFTLLLYELNLDNG